MARTAGASVAALEQVPLLTQLTKKDRSQLAKSMKELSFPPGKQVVVEGRAGVGFFIIVEGSAAVSVGGTPVRMLGPGDYFGEMALIHGNERSATITADTDLRCMSLTSWEFKSFVLENPTVAWAMLQTLAARLHEAAAR